MSKLKKWNILNQTRLTENQYDQLIALLLKNRAITTEKERNAFLHPDVSAVTPQSVGIDQSGIAKTIARIKTAIAEQEQIVVFGDYDVDGITGSAILWETLVALGAKCMPYIPNRIDEGYGLSVKGIINQAETIKETKLIITVDNGIVAHEAVDYANEAGIDVIITDHHTVGQALPQAHAIVHTTNLCGAGVAYLLSKELQKAYGNVEAIDRHLELAALGTVADLVPLTGANRAIVFAGLSKLQTTSRPGLLALFAQAGIRQETISVYDIGYIIGPRLNASGRIDSAMESLRLLCTNDSLRAQRLALKLETINKERQNLLKEAAAHAIMGVEKDEVTKVLIVGHESYAEGVIGLVAGKLVEAYYRPAIVLSLGGVTSKASVRSVSGFNIITFLRAHDDLFMSLGGHPMAAGFSIATKNIPLLRQRLLATAESMVTEELLQRTIKIDCELPFSVLTPELYIQLQQLSPFGMGNPEPVFVTKNATVVSTRIMGKDGTHLRLNLEHEGKELEAVGFGMGEFAATLHKGDTIDVAYSLDENTWNGQTKLQLKLKDIQY